MNFDLELFLRALGLAFVLEGLCWSLFPDGMREIMSQALSLESKNLRQFGLLGLILGLLVIFLASLL